MNRNHPPRVNFHIRLAEAKDLCAMVKLLEVLFRVEPDFSIDTERQRKGLTLLLNRPDTARLWVAEMEGRVVGMVSLQLLVSTAEGGESGLVEDLVVLPERRGRGVGTALLDAAEGWARARGIHRLQLLADRGNGAALAFYQRLSWRGSRMVALRRRLE